MNYVKKLRLKGLIFKFILVILKISLFTVSLSSCVQVMHWFGDNTSYRNTNNYDSDSTYYYNSYNY